MSFWTYDEETKRYSLDECLNVTITKNGKSVTHKFCEIYYVVNTCVSELREREPVTGYQATPTLMEVAFDYEEIEVKVFDEDGETIHREHVDYFELDDQTRQRIHRYTRENAF